MKVENVYISIKQDNTILNINEKQIKRLFEVNNKMLRLTMIFYFYWVVSSLKFQFR